MKRSSSQPRLLRVLPLVALLATTLAGTKSAAQDPVADTSGAEQSELESRFAELDPRYQQWLRNVNGLITQAELEYFLALGADFRRDLFLREFWKVRDPDPLTSVNELERRFEELRSQSPQISFGDPRWRLLLLNGPPGRWSLPDGREVARCYSRAREIEIWFYGGSERVRRRFPVIFYRRGQDTGYEVWRPGSSLRAGQRSQLPTTEIRLLCADDLLGYAANQISLVGSYDQLLAQVLTPPLPPNEWLATLAARSTDLPEGAERFDAELEVSFPARNQSRTAVEMLLRVPRSEAPGRELDGVAFHHFAVNGEILRDERVFESFSYRFEGPTPDDAVAIPMGLRRYLRPGPAVVRLLVEDLYSGRFAQIVRDVEVPSPEGLPAIETTSLEPAADGRPRLTLLEPPGSVQAGRVRFEARAVGELDRVAFFLDDRQVLSKRSPPYSVELDLGEVPAPHRVRVVGYRDDQEVATDQLWLNQGAQRFRVRMIEPRAGGIYPRGLTVRLEVDSPQGESPTRVDVYVNDQRATSIEEPPYVRGLLLAGDRAALIRAVAILPDGSTAEDSVVVNTAAVSDSVAVRLVEVPLLVVDSEGRPVRDLDVSEVAVRDDGEPVSIESFSFSEELPLRVVLMIDRSASMADRLSAATEAALGFAAASLRDERDRLAVLSFADETRNEVGFTNSVERVELALAGLRALGGTALHDAIAVGINALAERESGEQRALVLWTDGADENSSLGFEQVLDSARRVGVPIYAIGLASGFADRESRRSLERLAEETAGAVLYVDGVSDLAGVYEQILRELRARYLLTFQADEEGAAGRHEIEVEVARRGVDVRARGAYWKEP